MFFDQVLEGKPDAIFGLVGAFQADVRPKKVNLLLGVYKDAELKSKLMASVKKGKEQTLAQDELVDYLPFEGIASFNEEIGALMFGKSPWLENQNRIYACQSLGGTGALRLGAEFLASQVSKKVAISNPTWPNHRGVFERAGFDVDTYDYYVKEKRGFDFEAMCRSLEKLSPKTVVLLHASCHNPTGCDPTIDEWKEISDLIQRKKLIPFFDVAYQGFGRGLEEDAGAVRLFQSRGHEMLIAYSCSKSFSLYCQRVGALFVVTENSSAKARVASQVKLFVRTLYSNPPSHGARIVADVLQNRDLRAQWSEELDAMRRRLIVARENLIQKLMARSKRLDFSYLKEHQGMFSFIDLDKSQVQKLISEYAIYLIDNGRVSVAGLTSKNIDYVVDGILAVSDS